jgi:hypothetical protein
VYVVENECLYCPLTVTESHQVPVFPIRTGVQRGCFIQGQYLLVVFALAHPHDTMQVPEFAISNLSIGACLTRLIYPCLVLALQVEWGKYSILEPGILIFGAGLAS